MVWRSRIAGLKRPPPIQTPEHHSGLCPGIFGKDSFDHVGYEGMFIFKTKRRYYSPVRRAWMAVTVACTARQPLRSLRSAIRGDTACRTQHVLPWTKRAAGGPPTSGVTTMHHRAKYRGSVRRFRCCRPRGTVEIAGRGREMNAHEQFVWTATLHMVTESVVDVRSPPANRHRAG